MYSTFGKVTAAIYKAGGVIGLITSPAGIVIAVLAGVAAAAFLIIKNWDKIKPVVMRVKDAFSSVMPYINRIAKVIGSVLVFAVKAVSPVLSKMASTFSTVFTSVLTL